VSQLTLYNGPAAPAPPPPSRSLDKFSGMVGMARRAVPARVVAGGTNIRATLACERVAPLHAARTSQRDVPARLNTYAVRPLPAPGTAASAAPLHNPHSAMNSRGSIRKSGNQESATIKAPFLSSCVPDSSFRHSALRIPQNLTTDARWPRTAADAKDLLSASIRPEGVVKGSP
jgi:hypothetical protein